MNNPRADLVPDNWRNIRCCVWQREVGAEGTEHFQGYVKFTDKMRFTSVKLLAGLGRAHLERCKGNRKSNLHYCTKPIENCECQHCYKDGEPIAQPIEGPWYYPDKAFFNKATFQGKRNDIVEYVKLITDGATNEVLLDEAPQQYLLFGGQHTQRIRSAMPQAPPVERPVDCEIYWGPTRTGKSSRLRRDFPSGTEWFWVSPAGSQPWFCNYEGQPGLVFDEFDHSWFKWAFIKALLDNASPQTVQTKGGSVPMVAYKFRFSAQDHPKKWYPGVRGKPNSPWLESPLRFRFSLIELMAVRLPDRYVQAPIDLDEPDSSEEVGGFMGQDGVYRRN